MRGMMPTPSPWETKLANMWSVATSKATSGWRSC